MLAGVAVMAEFHRCGPVAFAWRQPPYEYVHDLMPIDILSGSPRLREAIEADVPARDIAAEWDGPTAEFNRVRAEYLLDQDARRSHAPRPCSRYPLRVSSASGQPAPITS